VSPRTRIVIVGGGPAGLAAARAYRAAGGAGEVTILAGERHPPYRRPPLSKEFLRGAMARAELSIEPPTWFAEHDIALRAGTEAAALEPEHGRIVTVHDEEFPFDACLLATGSEPVRPPLPGADDPEVLVLRTVENSERLAARALPGVRAVVIGSGFIGCEAAASLAMRGVEVTLVAPEELPQAPRLGDEAGRRIAGWLEELGVGLALGVEVEAIAPAGDGGRIVRTTEAEHPAELVLLATGVSPRLGLAERAGLTIAGGAVAADASMRTSAAAVLVAGDIAFAANAAAGRPLRVEHWGEALNQGEVAGRTLAGERARWDVAPGFWSTIGERTIKHVAWGDGWDEARLDEDGDGFTVWYGRGGVTVGVLTHERDGDYERGRGLVERGEPLP
jgi:3-phenylpropionate/trans-cinnamate dioxygenase ferredoxin reductase component